MLGSCQPHLIVPSICQYTSLKPLGDRVLIKIKTVEEKTTGGILLPSSAQSKPQGGQVVAIGEGRTVGPNKVAVSVKVIVWLFILCFFISLFNLLANGRYFAFRLVPKLCIPSMLALKWSSTVPIILF